MSPAHPENWPVLAVKGTVDGGLLRDVAALVAAAEESDGNPPLSEQTLVTLRAADAGEHSVLALALYAPDDKLDPATAQDLAGVAVVIEEPDGTGVLEIAVHPSYRNQGVGDRLVGELKSVRGFAGLKAWSHGNHEAAADLAARYGYGAVRELWKMRLMTAAAALPEVATPGGRTAPRLRARPGRGRLAGRKQGRLRPPPGAGQHDARRSGRPDGRTVV